jgi:hypothetical protein
MKGVQGGELVLQTDTKTWARASQRVHKAEGYTHGMDDKLGLILIDIPFPGCTINILFPFFMTLGGGIFLEGSLQAWSTEKAI